MPASQPFRLGYRPSIAAFRAIAILLLLIGHSNWPYVLDDGGLVSVNLFFALSGFLVTCGLIEEHQTRGRIDVWAFWIRRAIRLYPALVAATIVSMIFYKLSPIGGLIVVTYVTNFAAASEIYPHPMTQTWSLASMEQYFLLLPLTLVLVRGRWKLWAYGGAAIVLIILGWRFGYWVDAAHSLRWVYNGPTRIDGLICGSLLAIFFMTRGAWKPNAWLVALAWVFLLAYGSGAWNYNWGYFTFGMVGLQISSLIVVSWAVSHTGKWVNNPVLQFISKIAYSLYVWHYMAFRDPVLMTLPAPWAGITTWAMAFALATASYYLLERPINRGLRGRFVRRKTDVDPVAR